MDQYRDLGMREYLDCLAAKDDRGNAVAAVRGHDDQVTAFRPRDIDDRLIGMFMLDMDQFAWDAGRLRCASNGAESLLGMLLHVCLVPIPRVLDHLRIGREDTKRRHDCECGGLGPDPLGQGDAVLDSLSSKFRPIRWYQDVGIHRPLLGRGLGALAHSKSLFTRRLRIDFQPERSIRAACISGFQKARACPGLLCFRGSRARQ
jgi:hypothetical protein